MPQMMALTHGAHLCGFLQKALDLLWALAVYRLHKGDGGAAFVIVTDLMFFPCRGALTQQILDLLIVDLHHASLHQVLVRQSRASSDMSLISASITDTSQYTSFPADCLTIALQQILVSIISQEHHHEPGLKKTMVPETSACFSLLSVLQKELGGLIQVGLGMAQREGRVEGGGEGGRGGGCV